MTAAKWIVVPNWDGPTGFQHYKDRTPIWIKTYVELMSDDAYLSLTGNRRAILHGLWLEYAMSRRCLRLELNLIRSRLRLNVKMADLEALNHAGFIHFAASKPLANGYQPASPEVEVEKNPLTPLRGKPKTHDVCPICGERTTDLEGHLDDNHDIRPDDDPPQP